MTTPHTVAGLMALVETFENCTIEKWNEKCGADWNTASAAATEAFAAVESYALALVAEAVAMEREACLDACSSVLTSASTSAAHMPQNITGIRLGASACLSAIRACASDLEATPSTQPAPATTPHAVAVNALLALTNDQRLEAFSNFCRPCGTNDPRCQCWNDE